MDILDPLLDQLSDGVVVSDLEGKVLYMNPAAERLLDLSGYPREPRNLCQILCQRLFASGLDNCAVVCPLKDKHSGQIEVTYTGRHGPRSAFEWKNSHVERRQEWRNLRVRCLKVANPLLGFAETGRYVTVIEDGTAEAELQKKKEDWRSMIAHDLRNPIANIWATLGPLEMIPPGQSLQPKETELIRVGLRSCARMKELLDLYLDLAKIDSGAMPVRLEDVGLFDLVRRVVAEQEPQTTRRKMAVEIGVPAPLRVKADAELLFRVVSNIVDNAAKYVQEGGRLSISAKVQTGVEASLFFRDNGPGIAAEDVHRIFDRFYQAKARREGRIQGNGLGLTFCREALKAMGGRIDVESESGAGAEFQIRLPIAVPELSPGHCDPSY